MAILHDMVMFSYTGSEMMSAAICGNTLLHILWRFCLSLMTELSFAGVYFSACCLVHCFIHTSGIVVTCGAYKFNSSFILLQNFLCVLRSVHIEQVFMDQLSRPVLLSRVLYYEHC